MKKTILLAATLASVAFGTARAAETTSTEAKKPHPVPMATETAAPSATAIVAPMATQRPGDHLTSQIVGRYVHSKSGEKVGDVNDLVVDASGRVTGVVVGVGGFLGVGEKNVALPWSAMTMGTDGKGAPRLTVDITKDALLAAPTFEPAKG